MKYTSVCPAHAHYCWGHRHLMREDDYVCNKDYKRLPQLLKNKLWQVKSTGNRGDLSIVVDWLLENPLTEDIECAG
jgi:hypothetical protein